MDKAPKSTPAIETMAMDFSTMVEKPTFNEDKKNGIFKYGSDNLYADVLLDAYINKSNKHNSIIKKKVNLTAGAGLDKVTGIASRRFLNNINGSSTIEEMMWLLAEDYWVFNACAYIIRWNNDKTMIAAIDYLPVHKVRIGLEEGTFQVSDNWAHPKKADSNTRTYTGVSNTPLRGDEEGEELRMALTQIVYVRATGIGSDSYPHVNYQSAMNYIYADFEIGKFTLNNIKNNFVGGYHVSFRGVIPESSERKQVKKQFNKEYTGSEASSVIFTWNEEEGNATSINPLPSSGNEDSWLNVEAQVRENIFIAHSVTNPLLFGIQVPGSLGGKDEIQDSLEVMNATDIRPVQTIIENSFNRIGAINGIEDNIRLSEYTLINKVEEEIEEATVVDTDEATDVTDVTEVTEEVEDVAKDAMNGAQIASLLAIAQNVKEGLLESDAAIQIIGIAFPTVTEQEARRIVGV